MGVLEALIVILVIAWLLGVGTLGLYAGGGLIHLLLVVVVIVVLVRVLRGERL
jgi:hypothetical protein